MKDLKEYKCQRDWFYILMHEVKNLEENYPEIDIRKDFLNDFILNKLKESLKLGYSKLNNFYNEFLRAVECKNKRIENWKKKEITEEIYEKYETLITNNERFKELNIKKLRFSLTDNKYDFDESILNELNILKTIIKEGNNTKQIENYINKIDYLINHINCKTTHIQYYINDDNQLLTKESMWQKDSHERLVGLEKYFSIYSENKNINKSSKRIGLSDMIPAKKLEKILNQLKQKEFIVENEKGKYIWYGSPLAKDQKDTSKGQLIALSKILTPKYIKKFNGKQKHFAYTSFFNIDISYSSFKDSEYYKYSNHESLFSFL